MKSGDRIPGGLTVIITLIILCACALIGTLVLQGQDIEVSTLFNGEDEKNILSIKDYHSSQPTATAFQPISAITSQPTLLAPTATVMAPINPTATPLPLPSPTPAEIEIPASHYISGVFGLQQLTTLDCEARSAVDWARYFGVSIDEVEFIDKIPLSDDPEIGFVGDINGAMGQLPPDSYGVYPPPIAAILREYGLNATAVSNFTYEDLQREIANDRPVIVWIVNLPFEIEPDVYTASNGNTVPVAPFEHTWIVSGYNLSTVTVVDSEWTYNVKLETFLERWAVFDNRAIILQD